MATVAAQLRRYNVQQMIVDIDLAKIVLQELGDVPLIHVMQWSAVHTSCRPALISTTPAATGSCDFPTVGRKMTCGRRRRG
jgi:hypothetical protein